MRISNDPVWTSAIQYIDRTQENGTSGDNNSTADHGEGIILDLNGDREPKLYLYSQKQWSLQHVEKDLTNGDISNSRSLENDIVMGFYPVSEIDGRLHEILDGKDKTLSQATLEIIKNIHTDENETTPAERLQLKELAKSQVNFIAQNYLNQDEAVKYMKIIDDIMSYADLSKYGLTIVGYTSAEKGAEAVYKPAGAPDGYVSSNDVSKMNMNEEPNKQNQKKAWEKLTSNLDMINASNNFVISQLLSLDYSSLDNYKRSFEDVTGSNVLPTTVVERMNNFLSLF